MTNILGISAYYHESSACLMNEDGVIDYGKEETFTRVKGDNSFPLEAIKKIFKTNRIDSSKVDKVVFYERPLTAFLTPIKLASKYLPSSFDLIYNQLSRAFESPLALCSDLDLIAPNLSNKVCYTDHHVAHLYSALASSRYSKNIAAVIIDGFGDYSCSSIYHIKNMRDIRLVWQSELPNSIGLFYSAVTDFLGFSINEGEFKVMGLAAYGKPKYQDIFEKMIYVESGKLILDTNYFEFHRLTVQSFSNKFEEVLPVKARIAGEKLLPENKLFSIYADIASSAQAHLENLLFNVFEIASILTDTKRFIFSGGVAMNSVSIPKVVERLTPNYFHVGWSNGDAGASIGAAYWGILKYGYQKDMRSSRENKDSAINQTNDDFLKHQGENIRPLINPYICKKEKSNQSIINDYDHSLNLKHIACPEQAVKYCAELIKSGKIIATCIGDGEIGPRALGNRSLLCDGTNNQAVKFLNEKIKGRSPFRPTAPATDLITAKELYNLDDKLLDSYRVMGSIVTVNKNSKAFNYPTTHVDKTARLQIVEENTFIYEILMECKPLTNVIANTSFNFSSDPTVGSIADAIVATIIMNIQYLLTDEGLFQNTKSIYNNS